MLEPVLAPEQSLAARVRERWEDTEPNQRIALAAFLSFLAALGLVWATTSSKVQWRPLVSNASPEASARVVAKLDELGSRYQLGGDGSVVLVPAEDVQRLRVELAGAGVSGESSEGFELFESLSLGRSDFSEQVTYLRALQGELARTVEALQAVAEARVHINMPKRALFLDEKLEATAAVYVRLHPGTQLNRNHKSGIIHLVANSVEGLEPSGVTLFDASGALYLSGDQLTEQEGMGSDQEQRAQRLTQQAQALVDRILGPGNGLVTVQVEVERDSMRTERERAEQGSAEGGVLLRKEVSVEDYEGAKPESRIPANSESTETSGEGPPAVVTAEEGKSPRYSQKSSKEEYAVTKVKEYLEKKPGGTQRMTASLMVDAGIGLSEPQLQALALGIKTAIGFDAQRGDSFEVQALPFNRDHLKAMEQEVAKVEEAETANRQLYQYLAGGLLVLVVLGLVARRGKARKEVWMDVSLPEAEVEELEGDGIDLLLPAEAPEDQEESVSELLVRALEAVEREPELVARLMERWAEEGDSV